MRKIKDITLEEIKEGKNWKINLPADLDTPLEEWNIEATDNYKPEDRIAYSAIFVTEDGEVYPLIQIKEVGHLDYGGDYCERKSGAWKQLGLEPNPNTPSGKEFVANPLQNDPSFDVDWDQREWHRENFRKWIGKLEDK